MSETVGDKIRKAFGVKAKQEYPEAQTTAGKIAQAIAPGNVKLQAEAEASAQDLEDAQVRWAERNSLSESQPLTAALSESATFGGVVEKDCTLIRAGMNKTRRRNYTPEFLEAHIPVFREGLCYIDHPTRTEERDRPERSVRDLGGAWENVRWDGNAQAVLGDLRWSDSADAQQVRETFKDPVIRKRAGLSFNWRGAVESRWYMLNGVRIQEPIALGEGVASFDLVTAPTAGGRLS